MTAALASVMHEMLRTLRHVKWLPRTARQVRRAYSRMMDLRLNIDTADAEPPVRPAGTRHGDALEYEALDYPVIERFLDHLDVRESDVVYDIGCGKGRILCVAARRGPRRCVGIEFDRRLADIARLNADHLREPKAPIEVRTTDAAEADYEGGTVYCLFNPFGRRTVAATLDRIRATLETNPRPIRLGYGNAAHGYVMDESEWLRPAETLHSVWYRYPIRLWTSFGGAGQAQPRPVERRRSREP